MCQGARKSRLCSSTLHSCYYDGAHSCSGLQMLLFRNLWNLKRDTLRPGQTEVQEVASWTCVQTCVVWPNRLASLVHISCKKGQWMTCNQLAFTCAGWPNGEKLAPSCVHFCSRPKRMQVYASPYNSCKKGYFDSIWLDLYSWNSVLHSGCYWVLGNCWQNFGGKLR